MKSLVDFINEEVSSRQLQHIQNTMNNQPNAKMTINDAFNSVKEKLTVDEVIDYMEKVCSQGATHWFDKKVYNKLPDTEYIIINGNTQESKFLLSVDYNEKRAEQTFNAVKHGMVINDKLWEKLSKTATRFNDESDNFEYFVACDEDGQIHLHCYEIQNYNVYDFSYAEGIEEFFVCKK